MSNSSGFNLLYSKQLATMSSDLAKAFGPSLGINEMVREIAAKAVISPNTNDAFRRLVDTTSLQKAALGATGFKSPVSEVMERFAETLRLAQAPALQDTMRRLAQQQAGTARFQLEALTRATEALRAVDVPTGARIMEIGFADPGVNAFADALAQAAREQPLPEVLEDAPEKEMGASTVQKTAVWLFIYLCGAGFFVAGVAKPSLQDHTEFALALLVACYAAAKKINGED